MAEYEYDVFISYSREDHAWAQKLHDSLKASILTGCVKNSRALPTSFLLIAAQE